MDRQPSRPLLIAGVLLILLGMVLGAALPVFTNPRMALSSHQQGIVAGALLVLFGLVWPFSGLVGKRARLARRLLILGAYAIWIGTLLAASFGTSRATPIVGAGYAGARWQEIGVSLDRVGGLRPIEVCSGGSRVAREKSRSRGTGDIDREPGRPDLP